MPLMRQVKSWPKNIEHQSTLWHATPFALIFLLRIFKKKAVEEQGHNEIAKIFSKRIS